MKIRKVIEAKFKNGKIEIYDYENYGAMEDYVYVEDFNKIETLEDFVTFATGWVESMEDDNGELINIDIIKTIEIDNWEFEIDKDKNLTDVYINGERIALGVLEEILDIAEEFRKGNK